MLAVARTWLSISMELVSGRGEDFWPRPGRVFAAARSHTFADLPRALDECFARWDRAHLHQFWLGEGDGQRVGHPDPDDVDDDMLDGSHLTLARLVAGERFAYEFDFGDRWLHLCTVDAKRIDPLERLGVIPDKPTPYWGWGNLPDQYGRAWDGDDGGSRPPRNPKGADLPELGPWQWLRRRPRRLDSGPADNAEPGELEG
jgi:hypothetical protein